MPKSHAGRPRKGRPIQFRGLRFWLGQILPWAAGLCEASIADRQWIDTIQLKLFAAVTKAEKEGYNRTS